MTRLNELAAFVCGASACRLPEADQAIQRRHFTDTIVAAVIGQRCRETKVLEAVLGDGFEGRMAKLAAAIRMTEIDDIHMPSCTTPSSVSIPVGLALAVENPLRRPRLRDAIWVGTEVMARFGGAVRGPDILYREVWPTYLGGPLASAATACRMLGLDEIRTAHALSLALTLTAGGSGRFRQGLSPRWLLHGSGIRAGYLAAKAAEAGFNGDGGLLDREWLRESHGIDLDTGWFFGGLGQDASVYTQLSIKPYSSAKQAIAAVEALRSVVGDRIAPDSIRSVAIRVPKAYAGMIGGEVDIGNRATTFSSVRYQAALALFHPASLYDIERDRLPLSAAMKAFMSKVTIEVDEKLARHYPVCWPAAVVVDVDGNLSEQTVLAAPGDPDRRFTDSQVADKAAHVLDAAIGPRKRSEWLDAAVLDDLSEGRWMHLSRLME